jgi:hypothetical protein
MLKLYITESNYVTEAIDDIKKYYPNIPDDVFMRLIALDPTYRGNDSAGKYGKWLLNLYNKGRLSQDEFNEVPDLLNQFTTYRNRIQNKDLNSYKSLDDLSNVLAAVIDDDSMLTNRQKVRFLKNVKSGKVKVSAEDDYDVVLETPNFIVYVPNTHEASMKLGKGTEWCTAHENPDWYNKYTRDNGKLYIIKDKKTGERWQYSDTTKSFLDQDDDDFEIPELMQLDAKLSKFFEKFLGIDYYSFDGTWIYNGSEIPRDIKEEITKIVISDTVTAIPDRAFSCCYKLISVDIPNSVTKIGEKAFIYCRQLVSVDIPNSVTNLGGGVFASCVSLKSVKLPNNIEFISANMFEECGCLTSINIPDTVEYIFDSAFKSCAKLRDISLPKNVSIIGKSAFEMCTNLKNVYLPNNISSIAFATFADCEKLEKISIPYGVTTIEDFAFQDCANLHSIKIPDSVAEIKFRIFADCPNLTVYTNNDYVINYCNENNIPTKPLSNNESYKMRNRYRR